MPKYTLEIAKASELEMKPIIYEFEAPDVNAAKERKKVIEDFLTQITLGELVSQHEIQRVAKRQDSRQLKHPISEIEVNCQL